MKDYTYKNLFSSLLTKGGMAILSSLALISCGIQSGYTETDGIYYDPKSDKIEQRIAWQSTRYEDDYYRHEESIIGQSQKNQKQQNEKYNNKNWGNNQKIKTSSDWGVYTGTQNNYYYDNYSVWGSPYSFYSPYYFGYYNSYFGNYYSGWNLGFSWGNPWAYYNSYYWNANPYWGYSGYYSPWYYNPFYSPYYGGYYDYYYYPNYYERGYYPAKNYRKSSVDQTFRGNNSNNSWGNNSSSTYNDRGFERNSSWGRNDNFKSNNTWRNNTPTPPPTTNSFPNDGSRGSFGRQPSWGGGSNSDGGFRTR